MRENKLRHSFADQLGEAQESDELNSKKEARKLAFYLFWNVRPNFDRYVLPSEATVAIQHVQSPQLATFLAGYGKCAMC